MPLPGPVATSSLPRGAGLCFAPTRQGPSTRCARQQQSRRRLLLTETTTSAAAPSPSSSSSSFVAGACPRRSPVVSAVASSSSSSSAPPPPPTPPPPLFRRLYAALARSNDLLPLAVVASALLALARPAAFAFFESSHYPLALGFLSFSIGLSLDPSSFAGALARDSGRSFAAGVTLQWLIKPFVGSAVVARSVVPLLNLPQAVGTGVVLCSIVSGAQLSNYATFLAAPRHAPLSVLLTSSSTAAGSVATPALALLLLRTRLPPFDLSDVAKNLAQVVLLPIAAGISAQRALPSRMLSAAKPALALLALLDTCCCVGSSLASNSELLVSGGIGGTARPSAPSPSPSPSPSSPLLILAAVMAFHGLCALAGYSLASLLLFFEKKEKKKEKTNRDKKDSSSEDDGKDGGDGDGDKNENDKNGDNGDDDDDDGKGLRRCFAVQGAMQSSLLALLLAHSCFGGDPLVSAAAGVSTAAMSVFGFSLVLFWRWRDSRARTAAVAATATRTV